MTTPDNPAFDVDPWLYSRAKEIAERYPCVTAGGVYAHIVLGRPLERIEEACEVVQRAKGASAQLDVLLEQSAPLASAANGLCLHKSRVRVRSSTAPDADSWAVICRLCGAVYTPRRRWSPPLSEQHLPTYPGSAFEILAYEEIP